MGSDAVSTQTARLSGSIGRAAVPQSCLCCEPPRSQLCRNRVRHPAGRGGPSSWVAWCSVGRRHSWCCPACVCLLFRSRPWSAVPGWCPRLSVTGTGSSRCTLGFLQQPLKVLVWAPFQTRQPAPLARGPGPCLLTLRGCIGQHLCSHLCLAPPDRPVQSRGAFSRGGVHASRERAGRWGFPLGPSVRWKMW